MAALSKLFRHREHAATAQPSGSAATLPRQRPEPGGARLPGRSSYTTEEWRTLQFSYLWAFTVALGDDVPLTLQPDIGERPVFRGCPLAREVVMSLQAEIDDVKKRFDCDPRTACQGLGDTANLLDQKATASQARDFKLAVVGLAQECVEVLQHMLVEPDIKHQAAVSEYLGTKIAEAGVALAVVATFLRLAHYGAGPTRNRSGR